MDLYEIRKKLNNGINLKDIELRVTFYSRVSTDHDNQQNSLINQSEHFERLIKENKKWIYINGYIDNGITGTSINKRNNFKKMIEDAKQHKFDLIITKEISRFSRNTLDSIKYTRELLNEGVAVLFYNDNINTIYSDSELRLTIMASMAQDEIRRLSERVKFGMKRAQEKGKLLGNNKIYGYKKDIKEEKLIIVEKEAKIIKEIYYLYVKENLSCNKIAKKLNQKNNKTKLGKKWNPSQITRIITNPKYKGYYCARRKEIIDYMNKKVKKNEKNNWILYKDEEKVPPIINERIWNKANKRLNNIK